MTGTSPLEALRARIDAIDDELVLLLERRLAVVLELAAWKRARGLPPLDPQREGDVRVRLTARAARSGIGAERARAWIEALLAISHEAIEQRLRGDPPG